MLLVWALLGGLSLGLGIVILISTDIPPIENREYAQMVIGGLMVGFGVLAIVICCSQVLGQFPVFV